MTLPRMRFTVRRLMAAVVGMAAVLPIARETGRLWASMPKRTWRSLLRVGQAVIIVGAARAGPAGTRCVVVGESAWDDDSCYEGREIAVRVLVGDRAGEVLVVPRDRLRPL